MPKPLSSLQRTIVSGSAGIGFGSVHQPHSEVRRNGARTRFGFCIFAHLVRCLFGRRFGTGLGVEFRDALKQDAFEMFERRSISRGV